MDLQQIQHAHDLIGTSNPTSINGNQNVIMASRNVVSVTNALQSLAANLNKRNLKSLDDLFSVWDAQNPKPDPTEPTSEKGS